VLAGVAKQQAGQVAKHQVAKRERRRKAGAAAILTLDGRAD
jgi:hypothetical protein